MSPISGADEQIVSGFLARPDKPRWPYQVPIDWKANPFQDNNWRSNLSAWRMMDAPIFEIIKDAERPDLLRHCLNLALDWHQFNIVQDIDYVMRWYDMATGLRALRLSYLIDQANIKSAGKTPLTGWYSPHYKEMVPIRTLRGYIPASRKDQMSGWTLRLIYPS